MTEWGVVGVIAALVALFSAFLSPIVKLIRTITKLTVTVENLDRRITDFGCANQTAHDQLLKKASEHDERLDDHGNRITALETRRKARATT